MNRLAVADWCLSGALALALAAGLVYLGACP